jgi:cytochrome c biogenesis protein CcdA
MTPPATTFKATVKCYNKDVQRVITEMGAGQAIQGALVLGAYGLGRALPVLAAGALHRDATLDSASSVWLRHFSAIRQVNALALACVGGYLIVG